MKTLKATTLLSLCAGLLVTAAAQQPGAGPGDVQDDAADAQAPADQTVRVQEPAEDASQDNQQAQPVQRQQPQSEPARRPIQTRQQQPARRPNRTRLDQSQGRSSLLPPPATAAPATTNSSDDAPADAQQPSDAQTDSAQPPASLAPGEKGLRLNFRGVPLEMVLNYMSDAAGYIIVLDPKTELKGKVDVWSTQPVSKEEAFVLLEKVLRQNGYAAIRNGRMLTIVDQRDAKTRDIPVIKGNVPKEIPKSDQIVTQIIPVRHANATQLTKDLQQLLPDYAQMTANDNGNALVLTATQSDIRRMAEIVDAIDTSIGGSSEVRVLPLKFADAKDLASVIKELFDTSQNTNQRGGNGGGRGFFPGFGGGGGFPGFGGGPGNRGGGNGNNANAAAANTKVSAVADERSNSLVVSAPSDVLPTIQKIVDEIDVATTDVTEIRVFHLRNADPVEMADMLGNLFPDDSKNSNDNQRGFQFRGGFGPFGGGQRRQATGDSERMKKLGRVIAVADPRTTSVIVSASSELMAQIADMVAQLDADGSRKQKVFVYSLENADVQNVEQILQDMFQSNNTLNNRRNQNQNNILNNRQNQQNFQNGNNGSFGSGFGNQLR